MSRSERLLALLDILRRYRYPVTAEVLAAELGVSVRTIYRDIATLRIQGALIEGEAGLGFVLKPGFMLPPLMFTQSELEALVLGSRWVARKTDAPLAASAQSALAKIAAGLPTILADKMFGTPLLIGPSALDHMQEQHLSLLRHAIDKELKVQLSYRDVEGRETSRLIWPFGLAFFDHARIILAFCEKRTAFRHFRLDRIVLCEMSNIRFPERQANLLRQWQALIEVENNEISPRCSSANVL